MPHNQAHEQNNETVQAACSVVGPIESMLPLNDGSLASQDPQ